MGFTLGWRFYGEWTVKNGRIFPYGYLLIMTRGWRKNPYSTPSPCGTTGSKIDPFPRLLFKAMSTSSVTLILPFLCQPVTVRAHFLLLNLWPHAGLYLGQRSFACANIRDFECGVVDFLVISNGVRVDDSTKMIAENNWVCTPKPQIFVKNLKIILYPFCLY